VDPGSDSGVYATAVRPGLRTRLAGPLAGRARARRRRMYLELMRPSAGDAVVDVGCGSVGLATLGVPGRITGVDRHERPDYPGERFVAADARRLPFRDDEFDVAYSNSLIEHVPPGDRERVAAEIARVGRRVFVQTPNRGFPVEPHALLPLVHWLPRRVGRRLWRLGVTGEPFDDIQLLSAREMRRLFPGAEIHRERVGPLTKSLIAVRR
jgi:SAM-dependent methyltransferase